MAPNPRTKMKSLEHPNPRRRVREPLLLSLLNLSRTPQRGVREPYRFVTESGRLPVNCGPSYAQSLFVRCSLRTRICAYRRDPWQIRFCCCCPCDLLPVAYGLVCPCGLSPLACGLALRSFVSSVVPSCSF